MSTVAWTWRWPLTSI